MEFIFKRVAGIIFLLFAGEVAVAQADKPPFFSEKGVIVGFGYGINNQNIPEGTYTPVFLMGHFGLDLVKAKKKEVAQRFTLFFEPQVNPVILQRPGKNGSSLEFGVNVGLKHMYPVSRNVFIYSLISTGPHFIAVHTQRQARGFIFSDNMGAGAAFFISRNTALNAGFRIRHMSNANLETPNHGINTMNFLLGVSRIIR